jgi:small subunit ribosomal protein S1
MADQYPSDEQAPKTEEQESTVDHQEPAAEQAEPAAEPTEPVAEQAEPVAEQAEPVAEPTEPVAEQTEPTEEASVMTISPEEFAARQEEERKRREEERARKAEEKELRDKAYEKLAAYKESGDAFEVTIQERVKGGLRGEFESLRVFLPASHFGMRKNVPEEELTESIGTTVQVKVHELQADETGYKSAVVTRRDLLQKEFWESIDKGSVHDGVVTSVTDFGAFVNIGGVEGLVHVSRLSKSRIDKPADVVKKGDKLKVTVTDVDREKHKLSLSHKEHEADYWSGIGERYPVGTKVKGTVKRITDFGAYVQLEPRIEGLLRISELSWTQRVKHPSDVLTTGSEIEVEILNTSESKHQLALGYKQTQPNPWLTIAETLPLGTATKGVIQQVSSQGAVVRVNDTFDGFMPRSKMTNVGRGKKIDLAEGQELDVVVVDLDPGAASLILAMQNEDGSPVSSDDHHRSDHRGERGDHRGERGDRGDRGDHRRSHDHRGPKHSDDSSGVTLGDLLKDADKSKLNG